jgi:hypothetical protein
MTTWIDFKAVKEAARFEPILERYEITLQPRGKELVGKCPFHDEAKASFSVNTEKRVFHCFGCGAKGNVLDFVSRKEGVTIRKAAELIADWLGCVPLEMSASSRGPLTGDIQPLQILSSPCSASAAASATRSMVALSGQAGKAPGASPRRACSAPRWRR